MVLISEFRRQPEGVTYRHEAEPRRALSALSFLADNHFTHHAMREVRLVVMDIVDKANEDVTSRNEVEYQLGRLPRVQVGYTSDQRHRVRSGTSRIHPPNDVSHRFALM